MLLAQGKGLDDNMPLLFILRFGNPPAGLPLQTQMVTCICFLALRSSITPVLIILTFNYTSKAHRLFFAEPCHAGIFCRQTTRSMGCPMKVDRFIILEKQKGW